MPRRRRYREAFSEEIERGRARAIVDVPKERVGEISRAIRKHHPEATMRGVDPTIPSPFP